MKPIVIIFANSIDSFHDSQITASIKEDYHFLVVQDPARDKVEIQVVSGENIEPIELDKLIELTKINIK